MKGEIPHPTESSLARKTSENRYLTDSTFIQRVEQLFADRQNYPSFLSVLSRLRQEVRITDDAKSHIQVLKLAMKDGVISPQLNGAVVESLRGDLQSVRHREGIKFLANLDRLERDEVVSEEVTQLLKRYQELSERLRELVERVDLTNRLTDEDAALLREKNAVQNQLVTSDWPHASKLNHFLKTAGLKWLWGVDENTELVPDDGRIGDQQMYKW